MQDQPHRGFMDMLHNADQQWQSLSELVGIEWGSRPTIERETLTGKIDTGGHFRAEVCQCYRYLFGSCQ